MPACGEREAMVMAPPCTHDSAVSLCFHGCLTFPHRHVPPQSLPSLPLDWSPCSQQQPYLWNCSKIPKLQLPAAAPSRKLASVSGVCVAAASTVWFSFHLGCHRSAVSLSALNVLLWLRQLPRCGDQTPVSVPPPAEGRSSPTLLILLFFPLVSSSYWVLHGSVYSFPLVRYSCLLSAGILHALLCLKMYSWCIRGESCTPHPPTPPPSCSLSLLQYNFIR